MSNLIDQNNKEIVKADIKVFNCDLGSIRMVMNNNNEPMFCLKDVCNGLGIGNPSDVSRALRDEFGPYLDKIEVGVEVVTGTRKDGSQIKQKLELMFVTEPQLYFILMRSNKEKSKPFRQWVLNEVLPSIRKNGGYIANQENMSPAEIVAHALIVANNIIAEKDKTITEQKEVIEYQGLKLNNFNLAEANRRSKKELRAELNKAIRLLAEQKFEKDYAVAYSHIYDEFSKMHCIDREKINIDYLSKNNDYLAECLTLATSELL